MKFKHFQHKECEYFPCHKIKTINCIFCFCPLYSSDCNGCYSVLENGIKDCSRCNLPHEESGYDKIVEFLKRRQNEK